MSRHVTLVYRVFLVLAVLSLAAGQAEQSIFAQFLYAPELAAKEATPKPTQAGTPLPEEPTIEESNAEEPTTEERNTEEPTTEEPNTEEPTTEESLEVLPLLTRARRSGFTRERYPGGNDVIVSRFRSRMADPGWVPDVFPRFGGDKSSEVTEYETGNQAEVKPTF